MGLFDFLKPKPATPQPWHGLAFTDSAAALDYISKFMVTEWKERSFVTGAIRAPSLKLGILTGRLRIPRGNRIVTIPTFTRIASVRGPDISEQKVTEESRLAVTGLSENTLVTIALAGRDETIASALPESDGWIAFVIARCTLRYDFRAQGWELDRRYELR